MENSTTPKNDTDKVVDVRDEEINRLKEENEQLRKENEQLKADNEKLSDNVNLYKSLFDTVTEKNKSLNARIEAIKQILEI